MNDSGLIEELKAQLQFRNIECPDIKILQSEINRAIGEINRCRCFKPTQNNPYDVRYKDMIVPLCVYALSKIGIEGEVSHSENGVQRIYTGDNDYPVEMLKKIVPLAK